MAHESATHRTEGSAYPPPFSRRWLTPRFWPTWLGLAVFALFSLLPGRLRRRIGESTGAWVYRHNFKRRRYVEINLQWCFPDLGETDRKTLAKDYFRSLLRSFADYGVLWWGSRDAIERLVRLEGYEYLDRCLDADRPVILLTSHNVGLDMGATALTLRYDAVGLVNEVRNPVGDWALAKGRTRFHGILYCRDQGLRPVVRAIRRGFAFYYLPDEDLGPEHSEFLPFFGVPTATITALPRLARMSGAKVLPFATVYRPEEGRYVARIFPPLEDYPSGDDRADAERMNHEIEAMIRIAPEQYMWSMRLFKTRPAGEPHPYKGLSRRKRKKRKRQMER